MSLQLKDPAESGCALAALEPVPTVVYGFTSGFGGASLRLQAAAGLCQPPRRDYRGRRGRPTSSGRLGHGSVARGDADEVSDLDVIVAVADDDIPAFAGGWRDRLDDVTPTVMARPSHGTKATRRSALPSSSPGRRRPGAVDDGSTPLLRLAYMAEPGVVVVWRRLVSQLVLQPVREPAQSPSQLGSHCERPMASSTSARRARFMSFAEGCSATSTARAPGVALKRPPTKVATLSGWPRLCSRDLNGPRPRGGPSRNAGTLSRCSTFGFFSCQTGRSEEAVATYDDVVSRFGDGTEPGVRQLVANTLRNKGVASASLESAKLEYLARSSRGRLERVRRRRSSTRDDICRRPGTARLRYLQRCVRN